MNKRSIKDILGSQTKDQHVLIQELFEIVYPESKFHDSKSYKGNFVEIFDNDGEKLYAISNISKLVLDDKDGKEIIKYLRPREIVKDNEKWDETINEINKFGRVKHMFTFICINFRELNEDGDKLKRFIEKDAAAAIELITSEMDNLSVDKKPNESYYIGFHHDIDNEQTTTVGFCITDTTKVTPVEKNNKALSITEVFDNFAQKLKDENTHVRGV